MTITDITPFKHILALIDVHNHDWTPLQRACLLTKRGEACKITVFISFYDYFHAGEFDQQTDNLVDLVAAYQDRIHSQLAAHHGGTYLHEIVLSWQHKTARAVSSLIAENDVDVIIKSPKKTSDLRKFLGSEQDTYFIHDCPLPVWLVKERPWDDAIQVLTSINLEDDSHANQLMNRKILYVGDHLAGTLGGELHVADCYYGEIGTMHVDYNSSRGFKREASIQEQHMDKLKMYFTELSLPDDVLHFKPGIPDEAIPDTATQLEAELAIIGNNEDKGILARIMGDTAKHLAHAMPCDILILKPDAS